MKYILVILFFAVLSFSSCKKAASPSIPSTEQLPPETQQGKNTCGFLVNGKVWVPKGSVGNGESNLKWWYDPAYHNGTFNINGFRYDNNEGDKFSDFVIAIDNFSSTGRYPLNIISGRIAEFGNLNKNCIYYKEDTILNHNSYMEISKFDLTNGIIAGTFEFTLAKSGCDTIRITEGRFDIKL